MSQIEIPLLRESAAFAGRLLGAARRFGEPNYHFHRRVNWSHRFSEPFYEREAECFLRDSEAYLAGRAPLPAELPDVYAQRLRLKEVVNVVVKVMAHWLFAFLGRVSARRRAATGMRIYRKCYVEDIELVFDRAERSVIRAVYPFPLNSGRQIRYLKFLRRERLPHKLAGNPYIPADLLRFLLRRDVRSMMRLESRAQIRHAAQVVSLGVDTFQLSDEFNLGSLDFARTLARHPVRVINSAHGVGKYLPVHAYQLFYVLTRRQEQYYHAVVKCNYQLRSLNDLTAARKPGDAPASRQRLRLVLLSQTFAGLSRIVIDNEAALVQRLHAEFSGDAEVELFYKPHPTSTRAGAPAGFATFTSVDLLSDPDRTMYVSLFSTCQIDPTFKGRKLLVRGHLIHPEISFDDSEEIVTLDALVAVVRQALPGAVRDA